MQKEKKQKKANAFIFAKCERDVSLWWEFEGKALEKSKGGSASNALQT